jgi:condensin complex subunit 3
MDCLDELDDDLFQLLYDRLLERVADKEASVRAQAVIALSRFQVGGIFQFCRVFNLQGAVDGDEQDSNDDNVHATLVHLLRNDPSA